MGRVIDKLSDVALLGMIFDRCAESCEGDAGLWRTSLRHRGDADTIPGIDICAAVIEDGATCHFRFVLGWICATPASLSLSGFAETTFVCLLLRPSPPSKHSSFRVHFPRGDAYSPCRQTSDYFALNFVPLDLFLTGKVDVRPRRHALSTLFLQR